MQIVPNLSFMMIVIMVTVIMPNVIAPSNLKHLNNSYCLLNKSSCLAPALVVTKFANAGNMNLVTLKSDLGVRQPNLSVGFVEYPSQT
jgi:hypothetical protein